MMLVRCIVFFWRWPRITSTVISLGGEQIALGCLVPGDQFADPNTEVIVQHKNFSARDQAPVDEHIYRVASQPVQ